MTETKYVNSEINNVIIKHIGIAIASECGHFDIDHDLLIDNYAWLDDEYYLRGVWQDYHCDHSKEFAIGVRYDYDNYGGIDLISVIESYGCECVSRINKNGIMTAIFHFYFTEKTNAQIKLPDKLQALEEFKRVKLLIDPHVDIVKSKFDRDILKLS
jgi:hypothetical protein